MAKKRKSGFIPVLDQLVEEGTAEWGRVWDGEVRFSFVFSLHTFVYSCDTTRELIPYPTGPRPPVELPCEE